MWIETEGIACAGQLASYCGDDRAVRPRYKLQASAWLTSAPSGWTRRPRASYGTNISLNLLAEATERSQELVRTS